MINKLLENWRRILGRVGKNSSDLSLSQPTGTDALGDTQSTINLGARVLLIGFGLLLLWACFAPLDEGVSSQGIVTIETRKKAIQHLTGGVIKSVFVKEGDQVKSGDVLLELDDSLARANFEFVQQSYWTQVATENRLTSELKRLPKISFSDEILKQKTHPAIKEIMLVQSELFASRRASFYASMNGLGSIIDQRKSQAELQSQQLSSLKSLAEDGYATRNQVLQLEQSAAELRSQLADVSTTRARMEQEYIKEVTNSLADVRKDLASGRDRLQSVRSELERSQVRTPVDGQVVGLALSSVGGVVSPGQKLMDIVPKGEALIIESKIQSHLIDKVRAGQAVDVRFSTFANTPQLVIEGRIVSVSSDVIIEHSYMGDIGTYIARVEITQDGLKTLGKRVIQAGMPAEILIKTGERSLMTYLLHPLTKRLAASMKEE